MKNLLKNAIMAMVATIIAVGFVACSKDESNGAIKLAGKWYSISENLNEFIIIKEDNSVLCYRKDKSGKQLWENIHGTVSVTGNNISLTFESGNNASGTFMLEETKLTLNTNHGTYTYTRLADNYNIEGKWEVYSIVSDMVAIKDEIELPAGTMADGTVVPAVLKTSQLTGQFIEFAISRYLRDITITGNQLTYKVQNGEVETTMTKNFVLGDVDITITGDVAGHAIETKIMMVQTYDEAVIAIPMTKENLANMFAGYAIMLAEGGLAEQPDRAALEAFKKSFIDAFTYYNVTLRLRKK